MEMKTEEYMESCRKKTSFAESYIDKKKINCESCKEESCTFVNPPYHCNIEMVELREDLPISINKLKVPNKTIEQALNGAGL